MSARRSHRVVRAAVVLAVFAAALGKAPVAALEVPYLSGRVNDLAGLLSAQARERIESRLASLEADTGAQMAVLTVPSLEGDSLEDFSMRVVETWKLGRAEVDDGLLLLVARDDRKMRLEVGYGLEGTIPDILAGRILDQRMRPRFREGDFDGGFEAAVESIDRLIRGDEEALPEESPMAAVSQPRSGNLVAGWIFVILFLTMMVPFSLRALALEGAAAWVLWVFLIPFWAAFPMGILGFVPGVVFPAAWIVGFPPARWLVLHTGLGRKLRKSTRWGRAGSAGGWSWSSGRSGGGFSGGGFSGGGGSFGGGGASSSW